jgi:hypothetical protein
MPWVLAVAGAVLVFVGGAAVIMAVLPAPLRPVDYFLSGAGATLLALLAVFVTVFRIANAQDILYKKRLKE